MNDKIYAQIILSNNDKINLELYQEKAPISVENFVKLAKAHHYEKTIFHRVIKDFMIQTGGYYIDDDNNLNELSETSAIKGEFASNGWLKNDLKHELGVISMARTTNPDSATSQFFLCSATCPWLDGNYAAFGKTTDEKSNQIILQISNVKTVSLGYGFNDFPLEAISISQVLISDQKFED